jgi:hypothetical protein
MAAMILHEKDSAVNGKSNKKVYFLRTAVVTSLYAGGAFSSPATYSLDMRVSCRNYHECAGVLHRFTQVCRIESRVEGSVPHGCAHGAMIDVSRHTALVKGDDLYTVICVSLMFRKCRNQTKVKRTRKKEGRKQ